MVKFSLFFLLVVANSLYRSITKKAVPDHHGFKLFTIDPRDHDPVEIANRIWNLVEGKYQ